MLKLTYAIIIPKLLLRQSTSSTLFRTMSSSPFLQVLATSVSATNKAGDLIRDIMYRGQLDIVEKTGADDLQVRFDLRKCFFFFNIYVY